MNKKELNDNMYDVAQELLREHHVLQYRTQGMSMYPTLRPDDLILIEKCEIERCKKGDIIVFMSAREQLVCHRIVKIENEKGNISLITKGDNMPFTDKKIEASQYLGVVKRFEKNKHSKISPPLRTQFYLKLPNLALKYNRAHSIMSKFVSSFGTFRQNFPAIISQSGKLFTINAIFSFLQGILPFVTLFFVKLLVDVLTHSSESKQLWILLLATAFVFMLTAIINELKSFYMEKISQSVSRNIYAKLHTQHIKLALSHYENPTEQDKIHRAVQEAAFRPMKIVNTVLNAIKSVSSSLVLLLLFIYIRWYLIFILLFAILPSVLGRIVFSQRNYNLKKSQSQTERQMYYYNRVLTAIPFAKELKLFSFSNYFLRLFGKTQNSLFAKKIQLSKQEAIFAIFSQVFSIVLIFASLAILAFMSLNGSISVGTLIMFFFAFQRGYGVLNEFLRAFTQIAEDNIFLQDFVQFIDNKHKKEKFKEKFSIESGIQINNLSFKYETSKRDVLRNIDIDIKVGETVALVGANGSGKTTLIKLLCGFYKADSGEILYDKKNINDIGQEEVCRNISAVFQDFALYNIPAIDNIYLGNFSQKPNFKEAQHAASLAGIDEIFGKLPQAYNTILGNLFKEGEQLSIGQWQKIAIARAIYRNAPFLLLDEPSSALDSSSEAEILAKLREFSRGKTTIIVSHRLSSVQWVDKIYVLDKGQVVEMGTHQELLEQGGKYYELYHAARP